MSNLTVVQPLQHATLFDSLPYIDPLMEDDAYVRAEMEQLISSEMRSSEKKLAQYRAEIDSRAPTFAFSSTTLFQKEFSEVQKSNGVIPTRVDYSEHYKIELPPASATNEELKVRLLFLFFSVEFTHLRPLYPFLFLKIHHINPL